MQILIGLFLLISLTMPSTCQPREREYAPDEVLIKFKENTSPAMIDALSKEMRIEKVRAIPRIHVILYKIPPDMTVQDFIGKHKGNPFIEFIEPNYKYKIDPQR